MAINMDMLILLYNDKDIINANFDINGYYNDPHIHR